MRCPARMPDANQTGKRRKAERLFQVHELAFGPLAFEVTLMDRRDARRVIPTVFQPLQTL